MKAPFIYTSEREIVEQPVAFDNESGVSYREIGGEHSLWAARVPFLPAMLSDDFTRLGKQRIQLIMERQMRFIYDLARSRENLATFELRFISTPNPIPGQPNLVEMVFLGKVFSARQRGGHALALKLWEKFISNFPLEDPFNYPLEPVTELEDFQRYYEPIPFANLEPTNILEVRKYEDMPIRATSHLGRVERKGDYIAHPFVPSVSFNPMGRFLAALTSQPQKCYVGISIRPTRMFDQEVYNVSFAIGQFKKTASEDDDVTEEYIRTRSLIGTFVYQQLMMEREQLVMLRIHVVGEHSAPYGVTEALGSEVVGNAQSKYPTQWAMVQPADEQEMRAALGNLRYLEHNIWGHTLASPPLARLRYLCSPDEATGAFRLPVAPESGYLPGVLVKSEPFVAPADELELRRAARANLNNVIEESQEEARAKKVDLGMVYHRGNSTVQPFRVNVRDLTRHALIAGSTGSGKSTTIKHLLSQLWIQHRVPFLVLYPIDKPDYRELRGFSGLADDLLVFTLGDESTSPFRFNPFEVPDGLLLKTHLSRLMRVFMAAFTLQDPLPMIYREALRRVYREKGWDTILERGALGREYPIMSDFYQAIRTITDSLKYGREVQDTVRQASVIRIGDLLENAGYVVNVRQSMPLQTILNQPTVMEIGRVGSAQDTTLLMGFLLMRFAEEVERNPRPLDLPHITVVEEAHRLMAEASTALGADSRGAAGEDFSNILAEVRGFGEGVIIAEQIPTLLVKGAIGNTYLKIMHWLEDAPSFDLFGNVMNLNPEQRDYARTLTPGFAVVRSPYGRPVHIKVPEFGDQSGFDKVRADQTSDDAIRNYMCLQRDRLGIAEVLVERWESGMMMSASSVDTKRAAPAGTLVQRTVAERILRGPMQTCALCRPLIERAQCVHRNAVESLRMAPEQVTLARQAQALAETSSERRAPLLKELQVGLGVSNPDHVYCYLAHEANAVFERYRGRHRAHKARRQEFLSLLIDIAQRIKAEGDDV